MTVTPVASIQQFREIIARNEVSVFDFWADWCRPCQMISPIFETLSKEFHSVKFYKVDVEAHQDISAEANISAMPTFIVYRDGIKVKDLVGANPAGLQSLISEFANTSAA